MEVLGKNTHKVTTMVFAIEVAISDPRLNNQKTKSYPPYDHGVRHAGCGDRYTLQIPGR